MNTICSFGCLVWKTVAVVLPLMVLSGCVHPTADFRDTVKRAKDAVFPSLVYVRVITEGSSDGKLEKVQASGSGVIVTEDGEFLTNHHVIDRASRIRCQLTDGAIYDAKVIGKDKDLDVALLKLSAPTGIVFPAARLSTHQPDIGSVVLAMGAPWGLARSVSMGIISCNDRYLTGAGDYTLWYQTDAAISPGNSGGPLVDTHGEVVGLNARGNRSGAQGFTIPSPIILELLPNLRKYGDAHWAWFGIDWQPIKDFERDTAFDATNGVIIAGTDPQGPARAAGLEPNDRVVAIDGKPVTAVFREDIPALNRALALREWDSPVRFDFVRDGESKSVEIAPKSKGAVEGKEVEFKRWGFTAKDINRFDTPDLAFFAPDGGAFVSSVSWDGNADNAGFAVRDIIRKWNGKDVKSVAELQKIYDEAMKKIDVITQVGVDVMRKGRPIHLVLNYRADPDKEDVE
ncbi:MAG: trypsin-like peptidase domain-containing protein [Kiritimatiellae bacterium]|nr:trypsin-like peptidase domain-containing protein [Kiritimatiellia bacterium]